MREIMVHRHLYAHNSGVVDEKYVQDIQLVTAQSIETLLVEHGYPDEDIYWFELLKNLPEFIEGSRRFFRELPDPPVNESSLA